MRNIRLESTRNVLVQNKWLSGAKSDSIKEEFGIVCGLQDFKNQISRFSKSEGRLFALWLALVPHDGNYENLLYFLKLVSYFLMAMPTLGKDFPSTNSAWRKNKKGNFSCWYRISIRCGISRWWCGESEYIKGYKDQRQPKAKKRAERQAEREQKRRLEIVMVLENKKQMLLEQTKNEICLMKSRH
ncbi:hypothetical protein PR048_026956 [Dryococelus australis]|uniref:Uncharacterized protein n=1 Tax=Dryococelus australis TaxID=614101 RepID=A0ABQ9GMT3_9NEOP|nr:hypothetical protein PR048_026956 [Dryococelus australis]